MNKLTALFLFCSLIVVFLTITIVLVNAWLNHEEQKNLPRNQPKT